MASFAIEVYWPGLTDASVRALIARVKRAVADMAVEGDVVRYLGCTVSPSDEVCFLRLEGDGKPVIAGIALRIGLGDARITEMIDLVEN
jgi:hypothetical protein